MAKPCGDMIASLTRLPEAPALPEGVQLKRALCIDRQRILQFIQENFGDGWRNEAETTLASCPSRCVLAVKDEQSNERLIQALREAMVCAENL